MLPVSLTAACPYLYYYSGAQTLIRDNFQKLRATIGRDLGQKINKVISAYHDNDLYLNNALFLLFTGQRVECDC